MEHRSPNPGTPLPLGALSPPGRRGGAGGGGRSGGERLPDQRIDSDGPGTYSGARTIGRHRRTSGDHAGRRLRDAHSGNVHAGSRSPDGRVSAFPGPSPATLPQTGTRGHRAWHPAGRFPESDGSFDVLELVRLGQPGHRADVAPRAGRSGRTAVRIGCRDSNRSPGRCRRPNPSWCRRPRSIRPRACLSRPSIISNFVTGLPASPSAARPPRPDARWPPSDH